MINEPTNDPNFLIYYLSSICWYIPISDFKTVKLQFHGFSLLFLEFQCPPPSHLCYFLVGKIHMYKSEMALLSLLRKIPFF